MGKKEKEKEGKGSCGLFEEGMLGKSEWAWTTEFQYLLNGGPDVNGLHKLAHCVTSKSTFNSQPMTFKLLEIYITIKN